MTKEIIITHGDHSYPIYVGRGLNVIHQHINTKNCVIISDSNTGPLYTSSIQKQLLEKGIQCLSLNIPAGERSKSRETKASLEDQMQQKGLGRETTVIALGGGMITDLAGFIAATYCRGVPLIQIPTSFLAMVDAGIGGKNGVNTPLGKNLIGSIYHPQAVMMDCDLLKTLPPREFASGMIEVIKHAIFADVELFNLLESNLAELLTSHKGVEEIIVRSCKIKKHIVESDVNELHTRRLLNFGHTLGHAIEKLSDYSILHGEAVAIGMIVDTEISKQLTGLSEEQAQRIKNLIKACCPDLEIPQYDFNAILETMAMDKKAVNHSPRFILIDSIGQPHTFDGEYCTEVPEEIIRKAYEKCP